jgi:hypothetical protein
LVVVRAQFVSLASNAKLTLRNFYGVLTIKEYNADDPANHTRELLNGRILHGSQYVDQLKRRIPTTYYNDKSGIGLALTNYQTRGPLRVAVVGLGTGTLAAYGRVGDQYTFYEINPNVKTVAQTYFTYIADSFAQVRILLGDARLTLERQQPQGYDVIALDAFSSDAIPVHLLTKEAFELYLRHLQPQGVIAVHISNRHLDLKPVVGGIAQALSMPVVLVATTDEGYVGDAASDWLLLSRNETLLHDPAIHTASEEVQGTYTPVRIWTDQYSNLFQIMESVPPWLRRLITQWSNLFKAVK